MRKASAVVCIGLLLTAAACGGGSDQGDLADRLIDSAKDEDVDLDEDCVKDVAAKFSDDDAKLITDNFESTSMPNLSAEGQGLLIELFNCADISGVPDISIPDISIPDLGSLPNVSISPEALDNAIDQVVANLPDNIDKDCVRDALSGLDPAQLSSGQAPELASAMVACVSGG